MLVKLNMPDKFKLSKFALYLALFAWLILNCLPILWMGVISFRDYIDAFSPSLSFNVPLTFANYSNLWIDNKFYQNFYNTCFVTFFVVLISLSIGCLAGYGLSRYKGRIGFVLLLVALTFVLFLTPHCSHLFLQCLMRLEFAIQASLSFWFWFPSISLSQFGCSGLFSFISQQN